MFVLLIKYVGNTCWRRGRALTGRCFVWCGGSTLSFAVCSDHDTVCEALEAARIWPLVLSVGGVGETTLADDDEGRCESVGIASTLPLWRELPPAPPASGMLDLRLLPGRGGSCEGALALTTGSTLTPWDTTKRLPPCSVHLSSVMTCSRSLLPL